MLRAGVYEEIAATDRAEAHARAARLLAGAKRARLASPSICCWRLRRATPGWRSN